jgi:uncharacterized RDD family membrane protein YckC
MAYTYDSDTVTYELAGIGERFIALIIDSVILGVLGGILFGLFGRADASGGLSFIIGIGYNWYFWTRSSGQTPGKMLMKIRVVKANGTPISDVDAIIRYVGYYINSAILMLGWLWALADSNHQGLHDKLVGTYVVKV